MWIPLYVEIVLCELRRLKKALYMKRRCGGLIIEVRYSAFRGFKGGNFGKLCVQDNGNRGITAAMVLKGQLFMVSPFFLMVFVVRFFQITIMFGDEHPNGIPIFLSMKIGMINQLIHLSEITNGNFKTLNKD
jgi:hypothetical protein